MYFYRKGKGRFKAAPPETLKAALAGLERKRQQQAQIEAWVDELKRGALPETIRALLPQLLYRPDRNRAETKAFEQACAELGLSPARLLERCGALPSTHDYHLGRFLFEHYPNGTGFPDVAPPTVPTELPVAAVGAFSLDDATTTEIDDALSVTRREDGLVRIGVHIAAPGLGFAPGTEIDRIARERLSTAYMPGTKIMMLPPAVVDRFSLTENGPRAALSLYIDVDPSSLVVRGEETHIERVPIAQNLRHHEVDLLNDALAEGHPAVDVPFAAELEFLHRFALVLQAGRGKTGNQVDRTEYSFYVENDRVTITERKRGSPLDKLVAELMILVNRSWGKVSRRGAAIYRAQRRMMTVAAGAGVRLTTLVQLAAAPLRGSGTSGSCSCACARAAAGRVGRAARRCDRGDVRSPGRFQRQMSTVVPALAARKGLFSGHPRASSLAPLYAVPSPRTFAVMVSEVVEVDLIDTHVRCVYKRPQEKREVA
jgi:exoribonuclease-2